MRRKLILLAGTALLAAAYRAHGQNSSSLLQFNQQQQRTNKTGMLTLGSWAVSNFIASGFSLNEPKDDRYYFHQMNILWNTVNVTLAGLGYRQAVRQNPDRSLAKTVKSHHSLRRKLLFNAGLDVAYVVGGRILLIRKSEKRRSSSKSLARLRPVAAIAGWLLASL